MRAERGMLVALWLAASASCSSTEGTSADPAQPDSGNGASDDAGTGPSPTDGGTTPSDGWVDPNDPWNPPNETGAVTFPYTAYRCAYPIRQVAPSKPAATFHDAASGAAPAPKNLHLTFAGDPSSSVVVQWSTDAATMATEVRFGKSPTALDKIAHGFSFTYAAAAGRRQHELHLCGLEPGTTYYYDAGGGSARSQVASFVTAPKDASEVKILVVGDTRTDPTELGRIAQKALAEAPAMMVLSGDAVLDGGTQSLWDALFGAAPELYAKVPGIWAHGNHESLDDAYFAQLALPDNGGAKGVEEWFGITYGPMRLLVLNDTVDTGSEITQDQVSFLQTQLGAIDRQRTPFAVGMHHQPMYTTSNGHTSNLTLRNAWGPVFDQHHLNVDIAGHVHSYESTKPVKNAQVVTTDAQGTRYFNWGGGGAPLYGFAASQSWIQTRESTHGYTIMTVSATKLRWVAHRTDGSVIETIDVTP